MKFHDLAFERIDAAIKRGDKIATRNFGSEEQKILGRIVENWKALNRPYFKLWPGLAPSAVRLLSSPDTANRLPPPEHRRLFAVRLPDPSPIVCPAVTPSFCLSSVIIVTHPASLTSTKEPCLTFAIDGGYVDPQTSQVMRGTVVGIIGWNDTVRDIMQLDRARPFDGPPGSPSGPEATEWLTRVGLSVGLFTLLVADDPDVIEPVLLNRDEPKRQDASAEQLAVMVARAQRRGENGTHIGRAFETIPHYRRPHPAIRWTGTGRAVPRVVFVRGTVVHRDVATKVPTGHYASDGRTEIEPRDTGEPT